MCQYVNRVSTRILKGKHKKGFVVCYKVLRKRESILKGKFRFLKYEPGWVISNYERKEAYSKSLGLSVSNDYGIHVYKNKNIAQQLSSKEINLRLLPVRCYWKDLLTSGEDGNRYPTMTFKKVFVLRKDYDVAMKPMNQLQQEIVF